MSKRTITVLALLLFCLPLRGRGQCAPGTVNGITAVCRAVYSHKGDPLAGQPGLVYDVFYPEAAGPTNDLPIIIFWHGGAYRALGAMETGSQSVFSAISAMGFNVYVPAYSLTAMGKLAGPISPGQRHILVNRDGGAYFPTSASPNYKIRVDSETIDVVGQSQTVAPPAQQWNLTLSAPAAFNHSAGSFVYVPETEWTRPGNDGARFLAFLGRNAGLTVPGNPHDIRLWGFSAGSHLSLMLSAVGALLFVNDGEFSLNDFNNALITKIVAMSPPADEGCVAIVAKDGSEPNGVASLIGGIPHAQSVSAVDCSATGTDGVYSYARAISPVSYANSLSIPALVLTGAEDTDVTPGPARELLDQAGAYVQQIIFPGWGHCLDLFSHTPNQAGMSMQSVAVQDSVAFLK